MQFVMDGEIEYFLLGGVLFKNEVVFYHPQSKTLMFTDLIFNYSRNESLGVKTFPVFMAYILVGASQD